MSDEETRSWWPEGFDNPAFQVRRQAYGAIEGGDYVRGSSDPALPHTALRYPTREVGFDAVAGKGILYVRPESHYVISRDLPNGHTTQVPLGTVEVHWGWPESVKDTWREVSIVRSAFGHPATPRDGETIFRKLRGEKRPDGTDPDPAVLPNTLAFTPVIMDQFLPAGRWYYYTLFFRVTPIEWITGMSDAALLPHDYHHAEHLYNAVPPFYQWTDDNQRVGSGFLRQFMRAFGFELDTVREYVESLQKLHWVDWSPVPLLRQLGANYGLPYEKGLGDVRYRGLIAVSPSLRQIRGTSKGLEQLVEASSKYECDVTTGGNMLLLPDDAGFRTGTGNWAGLHPDTDPGVIFNSDYLLPETGTVSTPTWPGATITGPTVWVARLRKDVPGSTGVIACKHETGGPYSWEWKISSTGDLRIFLGTADGTASSPQVVADDNDVYALPAGRDIWLATWYDPVNHKTGALYSTDGRVWDEFGLETVPPAGYGSFASTAPIRIGHRPETPAELFDGRIYWVEQRTGLDPLKGKVMWRFDTKEWTGTATDYRPWEQHVAVNLYKDEENTVEVPSTVTVFGWDYDLIASGYQAIASSGYATTPDRDDTTPPSFKIGVAEGAAEGAIDFTITMLVRPSRWIDGIPVLVSQWGATDQFGWWLGVTTGGMLEFGWSTTGTGIEKRHQLVNLSTAPLVDTYLGMKFDRSSTDVTVTALTSTDGGQTWNTWPGSAPVVVAGTEAMFDSTAPIEVGAWGGGQDPWDGLIWWAECRTGLVPGIGSLLWRCDPSEFKGSSPGITWTDARGLVWTMPAGRLATITDVPLSPTSIRDIHRFVNDAESTALTMRSPYQQYVAMPTPTVSNGGTWGLVARGPGWSVDETGQFRVVGSFTLRGEESYSVPSLTWTDPRGKAWTVTVKEAITVTPEIIPYDHFTLLPDPTMPPAPQRGHQTMQVSVVQPITAKDGFITCGDGLYPTSPNPEGGSDIDTPREIVPLTHGVPVREYNIYGFAVQLFTRTTKVIRLGILWFSKAGQPIDILDAGKFTDPAALLNDEWNEVVIQGQVPARGVFAVPCVWMTDIDRRWSPLWVSGAQFYEIGGSAPVALIAPDRYLTLGEPTELLGSQLVFRGQYSGTAAPLPTFPKVNDAWTLADPLPTAAPNFLDYGVMPAQPPRPKAVGDVIYWDGVEWINVGPLPASYKAPIMGTSEER